MTKNDHLEFINSKGRFHVDCNHSIFSNEELETLEKFGYWFEALINGDLDPISEQQEYFIDVFRNNKKPETPEQFAWFKYKGRKALEEKQPDKFKLDYSHDSEDPFFKRDDWKKMRRWVNR
ncbi:MAG: DUF413 domain-containing protein [bacterium]|nr:DUF413 domain-containing protein [bacterium]